MTRKIVTIQYLRGLAALLVLASHALLYPLVSEPLAFGRLGWLGVILFFVISGFIMVTVTAGARFDPLQFMRRRIERIVPLWHPESAIGQFYTSYMPLAFIAGAWLGLAHLEGWLRGLSLPLTTLGAICALIGLMEGFAWDVGTVEDVPAFVGLLVFALGTLGLFVRLEPYLPRLRIMERIGDASYSIYLVHIFAVALIAGLGLRVLGEEVSGPGLMAIAGLSILGGVLMGLVIYRFVEKPIMNWFRNRSAEQRARLAANAVDHGNQAV